MSRPLRIQFSRASGVVTGRCQRWQRFRGWQYSTVSWSCRVIEVRMIKEKKFRDRIERIVGSSNQLHTWPIVSLDESIIDELEREGFFKKIIRDSQK